MLSRSYEYSGPPPPIRPTRPARPSLSPTAASELRIATFRLARRMRTQRAVDSMSDGQFAVLAALSIHGAHTLGELADRERVGRAVDEPHRQLPAGIRLRQPNGR